MLGHFLPQIEDIRQSSLDIYAVHRQKITILLNDFLLQYLNSLYAEFDGDIVLAIILGELGHQNVTRMYRKGKANERYSSKKIDLVSFKDYLMPCNPFSISEVTGIPRETVRRKFETLIKLGWVERIPSRGYIITPRAAENFISGFNIRMFEGMRKLSEDFQSVIE